MQVTGQPPAPNLAPAPTSVLAPVPAAEVISHQVEFRAGAGQWSGFRLGQAAGLRRTGGRTHHARPATNWRAPAPPLPQDSPKMLVARATARNKSEIVTIHTDFHHATFPPICRGREKPAAVPTTPGRTPHNAALPLVAAESCSSIGRRYVSRFRPKICRSLGCYAAMGIAAELTHCTGHRGQGRQRLAV